LAKSVNDWAGRVSTGLENQPKSSYNKANPTVKRTVDRMVAEVMLKVSNSTPEQKKRARLVLKQSKGS